MLKKILCISKGEFTQARGLKSMKMWDSVPVENFIVPVIHLKIGLWSDVLSNLIDFIDYDV